MAPASAQVRVRPERKDGRHPALCNAPPQWLRMRHQSHQSGVDDMGRAGEGEQQHTAAQDGSKTFGHKPGHHCGHHRARKIHDRSKQHERAKLVRKATEAKAKTTGGWPAAHSCTRPTKVRPGIGHKTGHHCGHQPATKVTIGRRNDHSANESKRGETATARQRRAGTRDQCSAPRPAQQYGHYPAKSFEIGWRDGCAPSRRPKKRQQDRLAETTWWYHIVNARAHVFLRVLELADTCIHCIFIATSLVCPTLAS